MFPSRTLFALLLLALADSPVSAQQAVAAPSGYGIEDWQVSIVNFDDMLPAQSANWLGLETLGLRFVTSPVIPLRASINALVPNGARLDEMCLYGWDIDANADISMSLVRNVVDSDTGLNPHQDLLGVATSTDNPGDGRWCYRFQTSIPIIYRYDSADTGVEQVLSYSLVVRLGGAESEPGFLQFRLARLAWHRTIRPAPEKATYDDVLPGDAYFQYVEAFAASGIGTGCGGDNFCPDNPVTRAQLALFLSRALGLHWPAEGVGYVP